MKKKSTKFGLNKKTISNFEVQQVKGGTMIPTASCILCKASVGGCNSRNFLCTLEDGCGIA